MPAGMSLATGRAKEMGELVSGKEQAGEQADTAAPGAAGGAPAKRRAPRPTAKGKDGNVGSALRSVYQQTVNEDVPDEMMQLLGKLI